MQSRCAKYLVSSGLDDFIEVLIVVLSFTMVVLYAVQTYYTTEVPSAIKIIELIITNIFIGDYLIRFFISEKRLTFFFSINSIITLLIVIPTFLY